MDPDGGVARQAASVPGLRLDGTGGPCSSALRDRVAGSMLGAAVGDALGAPFEFSPPGTFSATLPDRRADGLGDMIGGGPFDWEPGEFTDDTQMAVVLAVSLLERGGYDPDDLWVRWRAWASTAADVGSTTRHALAHDGWRDVSHPRPERTAANGTLMRAFPLALATLRCGVELARSVVLHQALLTHAHAAAAWGAWLGVAMMRAAVMGEEPLGALDDELALLAARDGATAERFLVMLAPTWDPTDGDRAGVGNGSIWGCLAQAVWAIRRRDAFADVIVDVIELGQDTDTVACVAGAIAGAREGLPAIPTGWLAPLHGSVGTTAGTDHFDVARLMTLADRLAGCVAQPSDG